MDPEDQLRSPARNVIVQRAFGRFVCRGAPSGKRSGVRRASILISLLALLFSASAQARPAPPGIPNLLCKTSRTPGNAKTSEPGAYAYRPGRCLVEARRSPLPESQAFGRFQPVSAISWRSWNARSASGVGRIPIPDINFQTGKQNWHPEAVSITLGHPVSRCGRLVFTHAHILFAGFDYPLRLDRVPVLGQDCRSGPQHRARASEASSAALLTRGQIASEAGFVRDVSGSWLYEECVIDRIFPTRGEVLAARKREERRGLEGLGAVGLVVSAEGERFGVELGRNFVYCQEAVENALARVGHGGVPEGTPTTMANARQAIEALGLPIGLTEPEEERGVLVGRVRGSLGERFAFFLFVNRSAPARMKDVPGYPGFHGQNRRGGLLGGTLVDGYIFGSRETPRKGETKRQFQQQSHIEIEVEEALCMQATGELCGI